MEAGRDINKVAKSIGVLFIIGTLSGVLSLIFTGTTLNAPEYLQSIAENENQIIIGSLFVLLMGFTLSMVPVMLYPIFKKYNEYLAFGAVVFRGVLEAVLYLGIVIGWFTLLVISGEYVNADKLDLASLQTLGDVVQGSLFWVNQLLALVFSIGAMMIYYLFYKSKLIPNWLSLWGLFGAVLYIGTPLLTFFSISSDFLMAPLALQEMVLAVWLIVKGFNLAAVDNT